MVERQNKIYLTGFMGSGKSTLAPLLANVLGYTVLDLDAEIERLNNMTISEMFRIHGESYFREKEHTILLQTKQEENIIVALGGGTITIGDNLDIIKSSGLLVYLKTTPEVILRRVKRKETRPMLHDEKGIVLTDDALRERIRALLAKREPFYSQADITIEVGDVAIAFTVDRIIKSIRKHIDE
ncbi:MAG: shikimate kinase [Bacteroidetes bacterium]|nr:MAG: shikimate kinase [Bacteroidota bacterium]